MGPAGVRLLLVACVFSFIASSVVPSVIAKFSNNYVDWIVKTVCLDAENGTVVFEDPYEGCKYHSKMTPTDPLPYNNFEQMGYQISDSFPVLDSNGLVLYFHNFDYEPFNEFNQYSGSDGYDVYTIMDNTVSISNTKDGGGYGSTFFGSKCTVGNGWALFPATNFLKGGESYYPISGVYWEHNAQSNPGSCPSSYSTNTLTSWELIPSFEFSGINGNAIKTIDTLVSFHGFETENNHYTPTDNFLQNGHLEVFYFTELYGLTRWEVWVPEGSQNVQKKRPYRWNSLQSSECSGSGTGVYKGVNFTISNCHDWSNVKLRSQGSPLPRWPLVNANLLSHGHFDAAGFSEPCSVGRWCRFGTTSSGTLINWSPSVSTGGGDANDGVGVAYLAFNCGADAASNYECGSPGSQAIYQDIVVESNRVCNGCGYLFGINARTQSGNGTIQVVLQLLNLNSEVVWQAVEESSLMPDNGDGRGDEANSVYLSAKFVYSTTTLPNNTTEIASTLRFLIIPVTSNTFYAVDGFVNRYSVN